MNSTLDELNYLISPHTTLSDTQHNERHRSGLDNTKEQPTRQELVDLAYCSDMPLTEQMELVIYDLERNRLSQPATTRERRRFFAALDYMESF